MCRCTRLVDNFDRIAVFRQLRGSFALRNKTSPVNIDLFPPPFALKLSMQARFHGIFSPDESRHRPVFHCPATQHDPETNLAMQPTFLQNSYAMVCHRCSRTTYECRFSLVFGSFVAQPTFDIGSSKCSYQYFTFSSSNRPSRYSSLRSYFLSFCRP